MSSSLLRSARRIERLIVPRGDANPTTPLNKRQTLVFAQRLTQNELNKPNPLLTWVMQRAQKTWSDWGKSDTKWKAKTVATGNKLLDKIDWEEYSLKTVHDPKTTTTEKVRVPL